MIHSWKKEITRAEWGFWVFSVIIPQARRCCLAHLTQACMPQEAPRECLAWLACCHGLCSLVHATHFCVKLKLSPHGQLVASCAALWALQPQHPLMPSTSLCTKFTDLPQFTCCKSRPKEFVLSLARGKQNQTLRPSTATGPRPEFDRPAFNQHASSCISELISVYGPAVQRLVWGMSFPCAASSCPHGTTRPHAYTAFIA